jgi:hypothetical protein
MVYCELSIVSSSGNNAENKFPLETLNSPNSDNLVLGSLEEMSVVLSCGEAPEGPVNTLKSVGFSGGTKALEKLRIFNLVRSKVTSALKGIRRKRDLNRMTIVTNAKCRSVVPTDNHI